MKVDPNKIRDRMIRKAEHGDCRHRVVAVGIDHRGRYIGIEVNKQRYKKKGGGWHAEELLIHNTPPSLQKILIARVRGEKFLPIDPCSKCRRLADKHNVTIEPMERKAA